MEQVTTEGVGVRWLISKDRPRVMEIERECFNDFRWTEEEFLGHIRQRHVIAMVAVVDENVVGFIVYELHKDHLCITNLAVDPGVQRLGVGTAMINRLKQKLSQQRRRRIEATIWERNLAGQCFFRANGFLYWETERRLYDNGDDAYVLEYFA